MLHLDTQILVWLFQRRPRMIPARARRRFDVEELAISPMVELELTYLHEIGRAAGSADDVLADVGRALDVQISTARFSSVIKAATDLHWTRDPFDRLIAANAIVDGAELLTADETIRANLPQAVW